MLYVQNIYVCMLYAQNIYVCMLYVQNIYVCTLYVHSEAAVGLSYAIETLHINNPV
jgi:hypothetical protein